MTTEFVRPFNTCKRDLLTRKSDLLLKETYLRNTAVDNRVRVALSSTLFPKDAGGATPGKENLLVQVCACAHASTYAHALAFRCCVVYVWLYYTYTHTQTHTHTHTHTHHQLRLREALKGRAGGVESSGLAAVEEEARVREIWCGGQRLAW